MRVAVGGIYHESNTFFSQPMTLERFAECQLQYGADVIPSWAGTCSEIEGFLEGAQRFEFDVIPTLMAWGMPAGAVTTGCFEHLVAELVSRLKSAGPLDGVLLMLHGAMVTDNFADADGEILRRVRAAIGPNVALVVTLDFHANLTDEMVHWANAIVGYDTYPHVDQVERGLEAAEILNRMLRDDLYPHMVLARCPLLPHILSQCTERANGRDDGGGASMRANARHYKRHRCCWFSVHRCAPRGVCSFGDRRNARTCMHGRRDPGQPGMDAPSGVRTRATSGP